MRHLKLLGLVAGLAVTMGCDPNQATTEPAIGLSARSVAGTAYTPIDLGTLPGGLHSVAYDINPDGQVVGGSDVEGGQHAVLWSNGAVTDLGTLGGAFSVAFGINPSGQVVGASTTAAGQSHAFLWENGAMIDLGTLGGDLSSAEAINPRGQVVGGGTIASGEFHGFLWEKGRMTDLGLLGATGINPGGRILGTIQPGFRGGVWKKGVITELGSLGGPTFAAAINPTGAVVGTSNGHAFLWEKGLMSDLGTLGPEFLLSFARDINPSGLVVGSSETAAERLIRAFVWADGIMTPLAALDGGSFATAQGINPAGEIVGESSAGANRVHATLWTRR